MVAAVQPPPAAPVDAPREALPAEVEPLGPPVQADVQDRADREPIAAERRQVDQFAELPALVLDPQDAVAGESPAVARADPQHGRIGRAVQHHHRLEDRPAEVGQPHVVRRLGGAAVGELPEHVLARPAQDVHRAAAGMDLHDLRASDGDLAETGELDVQLKRGTGNVLVLDDEESVRLVLKRALEDMGYEVISASLVKEA